MTADKELLKEVALELWNTTKKLRPGLPKAPRAQLVLKGPFDPRRYQRPAQAAMILGVIEAQEPDDEPVETKESEETVEDKTAVLKNRSTPRVVRKRSGAS